MEKDCYAILGVKPSADITEIRRAYRRLTLQYHPDRHKLAGEMERRELSQKFQEIQAAYNEAKRRLGM
ncbi:MAG: DnaJ domain-containing protein [Chitinophagales bacterium]|nr:DnaJ domain-containing protein [Chitinophagales bacterium]